MKFSRKRGGARTARRTVKNRRNSVRRTNHQKQLFGKNFEHLAKKGLYEAFNSAARKANEEEIRVRQQLKEIEKQLSDIRSRQEVNSLAELMKGLKTTH